MQTIVRPHHRAVGRNLIAFSFAAIAGTVLVITAMTAPGRAEESGQQGALAQQQRMRVLEARVQYLEEKLSKLEREAIENAQKRDQADDKSKQGIESAQKGDQADGKSKGKKSKANVVSTNLIASDLRKERAQRTASLASESPVPAPDATSQTQTSVTADAATGSTAKETATSQTPASVAADAAKESVAQETFVFRDQAPTLKKGQLEVSFEADYIHNSGFLQMDHIATQAATLRYGLLDGLEISAALPYFESERTTQLTPTTQYNGSASEIGGATVGLSYNLVNQTPDWPGLAMTVTGIYPGSVDPYFFSPTFTLGQNPIDILRSVQDSGHWGIGASLLAYKILDPLLVFGGVGATYWFPKTYNGYQIDPAVRYSFNAGASFALSEKATLAWQFIGFYQPDLTVSGVGAQSSFQEQYVGRAALTLLVFDKAWIEPSLAVGLTHESPSMGVGLTFRKRW